ncbi:MAG: glucose-6-phosphate isomerase [Nitrospirae bacterium]|nr:glucose-6-phosphate isomerase [Nitrospirota bacterium]
MSPSHPCHDPSWVRAQRIRIDSTRMMADRVGATHGIRPAELAALAGRAKAAHDALARRRAAGELGFYDLPGQDTAPIDAAAAWARGFENFVVVGIGGSSLGPKATHQALRHPFHNLLPPHERGGPRLFFMENVDPATIAALLAMLDPQQTCVNVVTKSGGTAETLANYMVARAWLERAGLDPARHLIATTDPDKGDLRKIARAEGWRTLPVPPNVGGRFSQLTAVGLLPAAVCGIDVAELLAGAADMAARCAAPDLDDNPAYRLAALHYLAATAKGKPITVLMPYADGLKGLADWFVQLWAESLGKEHGLDGATVHTGQTPLPAVGAIDQHSQVQLFVAGPNDKMTAFVRLERFADGVTIPPLHKDSPALGYLGGATLGALLNAEQAATEMVLTDGGRPSYRIDVPELNPFAFGQLLMLFEIMTAFAGGLYGIDPFDQPGVERGKVLTYGAMGREGYENLLGS